jgi:hypothetical protein
MAIKFQFRRDTSANWTSSNPILAEGEIGLELDTDQFKIGDGSSTYGALPYGGIQGPAQTLPIRGYGTGQDGNLNLSAGTVVLIRDMFYDTLTISGTGKIVLNGFKLYARSLDATNGLINSIVPTSVPDGLSATTQTGAAGGVASTIGTVNPSVAGGGGATGIAGVGPQAAASTSTTPSNGGNSGAGGAGGNGTPNAGGASRGASTATTRLQYGRWVEDLLRGIVLIQAGASGPGGSAGGGDGVNLGRGGGGGGVGNGPMMIFAKTLITSGSTAAGFINSNGGNGGNGATATVGNVGGGGGGAGGGGGFVYLAYETKVGPAVTNLITANGGSGGIGGNGFGTGIGGAGGGGGDGGRIQIYKSDTEAGSETVGTAGTAGSLGAGVNGGAAGVGGLCQVTL